MLNRIRSWLGIGRSGASRSPDGRRRAGSRDDNGAATVVPIIAASAVLADADRHDGDGGFDGGSGAGDASDSAGGWGGGDAGGGWGGGDFGGGGDAGGAL